MKVFQFSQAAVSDHQGHLQKLLAGTIEIGWLTGEVSQELIKLLRYVRRQTTGVVTFEAVEYFASFLNLSGLVVEDAERRIAADPFGNIHRLLNAGRWRVPTQYGGVPCPRGSFLSRGCVRRLLQRLLRAVEIVLAKLDQRQREIVLVIVRVAAYCTSKISLPCVWPV